MEAESEARQCSFSGRPPGWGLSADLGLPGTLPEEAFLARGYSRVAGVDEAGRGPLAGPVVAAAVLFPFPCPLLGVDDSKRVPAPHRETLFDAIHRHALAVGVAAVDAETIDRVNILQATRLAMRQALEALSPAPDCVLVDAVTIPGIPWPQEAMIGGDRISVSVAAASIVAKVTRDRLLVEMDRRYPEYGFAEHKGYPTRRHLECLARHGACPEHRRSFAPVRRVVEQGRLFDLDERRPNPWTGP